jgi:hypothetical protein
MRGTLSSWISGRCLFSFALLTTVRRRATVFAGASVVAARLSPKPRVFADSGPAGEKVTTARLIAVEIARKNTRSGRPRC